MSGEVNQLGRFDDAVARLEQLREFAGPERVFWFHLLTTMAGVSGARLGVLLRAGPQETPGWEAMVNWPAQDANGPEARAFATIAGDLAETCVQQGSARRGGRNAHGAIDWCVAVRVTLDEEPAALVLAFLLAGASEAQAEEALRRLRLLAPLPTLYRLRQQVTHSETAVAHFAAVLDLVSALNTHQRFLAVAMSFCNELATRHQCDRVSLGWLEDGYVKVAAISRSERFERKMEAIQNLEAVMEEALDQDEVVVWPAPEGPRMVTRAHEKFSAAANVPFLAPCRCVSMANRSPCWSASGSRSPLRKSKCGCWRSTARCPCAGWRICGVRIGGSAHAGWRRGGRS